MQQHGTVATWRHPVHQRWRPFSQSDDASGPNPPPRHVSGQLQGPPHHVVREGDTNVGGSAIALLRLLSGDLGATQCGAPSKPQPTTWNGRSGIWRHNCSVRMACPTAKTTRIKLTRPSPGLVYHCNDAISRSQEGPLCCNWQGLSPVLMPLTGLAPASPYFGLRAMGRLSFPK